MSNQAGPPHAASQATRQVGEAAPHTKLCQRFGDVACNKTRCELLREGTERPDIACTPALVRLAGSVAHVGARLQVGHAALCPRPTQRCLRRRFPVIGPCWWHALEMRAALPKHQTTNIGLVKAAKRFGLMRKFPQGAKEPTLGSGSECVQFANAPGWLRQAVLNSASLRTREPMALFTPRRQGHRLL